MTRNVYKRKQIPSEPSDNPCEPINFHIACPRVEPTTDSHQLLNISRRMDREGRTQIHQIISRVLFIVHDTGSVYV